MSSKRKISSLGLQRRVRPRREEEELRPEPDFSEDDSEEQETDGEEGSANGDGSDNGDEDGSEPESGSEPEQSHKSSAPKVDLSSVSFGALARAQASMPALQRKTKNATDEEPVTDEPKKFAPRSARSEKKPPPKRSSKNAPQEQTSKKPVSRRREILPDKTRQFRDPRFDPLAGPLDESKSRRAYAFLDEYRDSEMADLRAQIKKTKDLDAKETLKRQLLSMESKKKARSRKDEAEKLLVDHRRQEKDLVAQGKQPFYLKKSEQKKQVLTNRFAGMTKGQVDHAIERKRKKISSKEKKELGSLPRARTR